MVQTKGIRFNCKLCGGLAAKKTDAVAHIQENHSLELRAFKAEKRPALFTHGGRSKAKVKVSFSRADVLGKRPRDDSMSFGGWAKKEKPDPAPMVEAAANENEPVLIAPP